MSRPLAIAFLACNKNAARYLEDASFYYRCINLAQALAERGHDTWCGHHTLLPNRRFDVVVLHRPRHVWPLSWRMAIWRRQAIRIVADVDDLVFQPHLAELSPGVLNGVVSADEVRALFLAHSDALRHVDQVTVATTALAQELRGHLPATPVTVLHNAVPWSWLGVPANDLAGGGRVISYLPGTRSHDRDFAMVAPVLTELLRCRPDLRLDITGPGRFELDVPAAQCLRREKQAFSAYPYCLRQARVNLMPLEDTRFNRCKSALKVIEAGFWQIPTVCSPLPDALRFEGAGACIASKPGEWRHWLEQLCLDDAFHRSQCQGLRERILARASVRDVAAQWLDQLGAAALVHA